MAVNFTSLEYFMNENTLSRDTGMGRPVNIVLQLTSFPCDGLRSTQTHRINMITMKPGTMRNICSTNDDWRVIVTRFSNEAIMSVTRHRYV